MRSFSDDGGAIKLRSIFSRSSRTISPQDYPSPNRIFTEKGHKRAGTRIDILGSPQASSEPKRQARRHRSYSSLEKLKPSLSSKQLSVATHRQRFTAHKGSQDLDEDCHFSSEELDLGQLLHHGQVQIAHSTWRKKHEYLVLTEKFLIRFKSSRKAADYFPWIVPTNDLQHSPSSSISSYIHEDESGRESPSEPPNRRPSSVLLQNIVAVRVENESQTRITVELITRLEDGFFGSVITIGFHVQLTNGNSHWLELMASMAKKRQLETGWPLPKEVLNAVKDFTVGDEIVINERDNTANVYFINQKSGGLGSMTVSEDTTKEAPMLGLLLNGKYKIYIISFAKKTSRLSQSEDRLRCESYGLVSLVSATISGDHETVRLLFRNPQKPPMTLEFETIHGIQLIQELYTNLGRLIPNQTNNPFLFRVPSAFQDTLKPINRETNASISSFQRTLKAFSLSFGLEIEDFNFEVLDNLEDSPAIVLRPRYTGPESAYTSLHLIAFLRALRHNECYVTVSLAGIPLDPLLENYDYYGDDHIHMKAFMGSEIIVTQEEMKHASVLIQELSAMIMTSPALRRLDLSGCITKLPSNSMIAGDGKSCGLLEAVYPLCVNRNTNLDAFIFNDIHFSPADVAFILGMVKKPYCKIRGMRLARCHLETIDLRDILQELPGQRHTLEFLDFSYNPGSINSDTFCLKSWTKFTCLRELRLCGLRLDPPLTESSLLPGSILQCWMLEGLYLDRTRLNQATVQSLIDYLESEASKKLENLSLVGCQLNSFQAAAILRSSTAHEGIHVDLSENNVEADLRPLVSAISANSCPSYLNLRFLEFKATEDLESFFQALQWNTSIKHLDLSGAAVGFLVLDNRVASALRALFECNCTLEQLKLSGENSRLDLNNLGGIIAESLAGLAKNTTLRVLHLENQKLGIVGANILAETLRQNQTLRTLEISNNNIPLTGFTTLVQALKDNKTLIHISKLDECKTAALQSVQSVIADFNQTDLGLLRRPVENEETSSTSLNRRIGGKSRELIGMVTGHKSETQHRGNSEMLSKEEVQKIIEDRWKTQQKLLEEYLLRNRSRRGIVDQHSPESKDGEDSVERLESRLEGLTAVNTPTVVSEDACGIEKLYLEKREPELLFDKREYSIGGTINDFDGIEKLESADKQYQPLITQANSSVH